MIEAHEHHSCPLCGLTFTGAQGAGSCMGCPLGAHCETICCPRCGYSFVERSATLGFLNRMFHSTRGLFHRLTRRQG